MIGGSMRGIETVHADPQIHEIPVYPVATTQKAPMGGGIRRSVGHQWQHGFEGWCRLEWV
jgi:hypothetical protein